MSQTTDKINPQIAPSAADERLIYPSLSPSTSPPPLSLVLPSTCVSQDNDSASYQLMLLQYEAGLETFGPFLSLEERVYIKTAIQHARTAAERANLKPSQVLK